MIQKHELVEWVEHNKEILKVFLCGTGTTARIIVDKTGLPVRAYNSTWWRSADWI